MTIQLPVPTDSAQSPEIPASAGMTKYSIFSPQAQGAFLENLAHSGNVRLACKLARVSPQTAYRARRKSPALARAWDAALVSARHNAEEVLADRALNGWEEAVFYHGEEVAVRRRYSDRLLLAHLARLDRLAEREDVAGALATLDDQIDALQRGEELSETVRSELVEDLHLPSSIGSQESTALRQAQGERVGAQPKRANEHPENHQHNPVPCVPSGRIPSDDADDDSHLGPSDYMWFGNRLNRMWDARPRGVPAPHEQGDTDGFIEELQILAYEADLPEWWLITSEEALDAALESALSPS